MRANPSPTDNIKTRIIGKYKSLTWLERIIIGFIASVFLFLFTQNFIFSSSFDVLLFRSIDDGAFHHVLRHMTNSLIHGEFEFLITTYNYGYGWLFWMLHYVLTLPFALLSYYGDIDFLLISGARNISLFFMIGVCFLTFKITKKYTDDRYIPYFAVLLFISYLAFATASLGFKTIAQTTFFCAFSFYFTIRNDELTKKDLRYIAFALAAALGTKINTALFAPLIAVFLIDRFGWKITKENIHYGLYFLAYFIPVSIFFINPSLFLAPFDLSFWTDYKTFMQTQLGHLRVDNGSIKELINTFIQAFRHNLLHYYILLIMALMFCIKIILDIKSKTKHRFDFLYISTFLVFAAIYISYTIKIGGWYVANYFFSFSFLLVLAIVTIDKLTDKRLRVALLITLFVANFSLQQRIIEHYRLYFIISDGVKGKIQAQKEMQQLIGKPKEKLNFLFELPIVIYSNLDSSLNNKIRNVALNANWGSPATADNIIYDYIVLAKNGFILMSEQDFQKSYASRNKLIQKNRKKIKPLLETGNFQNAKYKIIYDKNQVLVFAKQ